MWLISWEMQLTFYKFKKNMAKEQMFASVGKKGLPLHFVLAQKWNKM